jgi:hypothetical protein
MALSKSYIYTVAHASGSERYIFLPWPNSASAYFREIPCSSVANASAYSWSYFRVIPCSSVANASASFRGQILLLLISVKFRVNPWQMLLLILMPLLPLPWQMLPLGLPLHLLMFNFCAG